MITLETLRHVIPAHAVYLPLNTQSTEPTLQALLIALSSRSEQIPDESAVDSHWQALERRRVGLQRWDVVALWLLWHVTRLDSSTLSGRLPT